MHFIDPLASISPLADLEMSKRGSKLVVAANAMIDAFVKIKWAGGSGDIVIGEYSHLNSGIVLYSGHGITIGERTLIAANCVFAATNHEYRDRERPINMQGFRPSKGGIIVEDDVWIGAGTTLLDGARVRRGAVVGAGSIVRSEVPAHTVVAGSPPRTIGVRGRERGMIRIAASAAIASTAKLEASARGATLTIGERAYIDDFVKIFFAGGQANISIEEDVRVNAGCVLCSGNGIRLRQGARISANTTLTGADHVIPGREESIWTSGFAPSRGGIDVGEGAWVGPNCVLLDGAHIGTGAVVKAGSVIDAPVAAHTIVSGSADRVIGVR